MKVGLYFGSFNPVHVGHMIIANYMIDNTELDALWMVVTPHNPFKKKASLARGHDRLHLVTLAIGDNHKIRASNLEFDLPQPTYTIDTLAYASQKYPQHEFSIIMGGDNLASLHKWKNYEFLLDNYTVYVYKRPSYELPELATHHNVSICEAPLLNISSSYIRQLLKDKKSIQYLVPDAVYNYINGSSMYS